MERKLQTYMEDDKCYKQTVEPMAFVAEVSLQSWSWASANDGIRRGREGCRVQCHITVMHLSSKGMGFYSSGSSLLMDSCLSLMCLIQDLCIHVSFREAFKGWVWGRVFCFFFCFEWAEVSDFHQLLGAWLGSALPEWSSSALSQSESSYRPWFHGKTWIIHISWLEQAFFSTRHFIVSFLWGPFFLNLHSLAYLITVVITGQLRLDLS